MDKGITLEEKYLLQQQRIHDIALNIFPGGDVLFDTRFKLEAIAFTVTDAKGARVAYVPGGTAVEGIEKMSDEEIKERIEERR
jgi:hypothetical protein